MIKKVAIFGSDNGRVTSDYAIQLLNVLLGHGVEVLLNKTLFDRIAAELPASVKSFSNLYHNRERADMVFSVGGDGTFLETITQVRDSGIPVAGVNAGRLGFLANIHDDIEGSITRILNGRYSIIERYLIELLEPPGIMGKTNVALNDITIQKADLNMIRIKVFVDDLYLNTYWADGLILSTATGSTAYNLSTGGPILSPGDDSIIISPLSPHNLTVRPIVLPGNSHLKLVVEGRSPEYLVTCDFRSVRLPFYRELEIVQPAYRLNTVNVEGQDFFNTLREKLMWGADPRN
ncbi:MAG: NAD(+) kinase [Bacteroidia bacterium]|nr:MAG: NAD(+) kinase [Bacteroidia bacterium]